MNPRRLALGSVAVWAALGLALTSCSGDKGDPVSQGTTGAPTAPGQPSTGGSASADPAHNGQASADKTMLLNAVKKLADTSYRFTAKSSVYNGGGQFDAGGKKFAINITGKLDQGSMTIKVISLPPNGYVKLDLGAQLNQAAGVPDKWMHIDSSKIASGSVLDLDIKGSDPFDLDEFMVGVTDVKKVDAQHYTAVADLSKAGGDLVDGDIAEKLGDKAHAVPVKFTLDGQGRFTKIFVDTSAVDNTLSTTVTYSDYGAPVDIKKPGGVVDMPDTVQQLFSD